MKWKLIEEATSIPCDKETEEIEVVDMSNVVDESTTSHKEIRFGCLEVETRPDGSVHYTIY